jgi:hypothetical protein
MLQGVWWSGELFDDVTEAVAMEREKGNGRRVATTMWNGQAPSPAGVPEAGNVDISEVWEYPNDLPQILARFEFAVASEGKGRDLLRNGHQELNESLGERVK